MKDYIIVNEDSFEKARKRIRQEKQKNPKAKIIFTSSDDKLSRKILEKEPINILVLLQSQRKDRQKQRDSGFNQQQTIEVPTLRITDKDNVDIELYRTEESGTVFYKVASVVNDKTVNNLSIVDNSVSNTDLISQEVLYTTGGELENIAAPPSSIIESFKSRKRSLALVCMFGYREKNKKYASRV